MKTLDLDASRDLFYELFADIWMTFCNTLPKVLWQIFPTDPWHSARGDYSWHLLVNYSVAATNLTESLDHPVSALKVDKFMLGRAVAYPICAFALLEIRLGAVVKLMRNLERLGPATVLESIRCIPGHLMPPPGLLYFLCSLLLYCFRGFPPKHPCNDCQLYKNTQ